MTQEQHEQRSEGWLQQRKGRVTASLVGAILGHSPYMTRAQAMRSMIRDYHGAEREFQGNVATRHGTMNEAGVVIDFQMETGLKVEKAYFVEFEDWAGASPDGYVGDEGLLEIKCPYSLRAAEAPVPFKSIMEQQHYLDQIHFQMFCTERRVVHFYQWAPNGTKHEVLCWNQDWMDRNIPRLRQFHAEFMDEAKNNVEEHLHQKPRVVIDTAEAHRMIREWDEIVGQLAQLEERKKDLLKQIIGTSGEKNADFAGRKLTLTKKAGSISYAKAIKELLPDADLEKWRGKETQFWGIR